MTVSQREGDDDDDDDDELGGENKVEEERDNNNEPSDADVARAMKQAERERAAVAAVGRRGGMIMYEDKSFEICCLMCECGKCSVSVIHILLLPLLALLVFGQTPVYAVDRSTKPHQPTHPF